MAGAPRPRVALILLNNSGIGGTERRFGRVYAALRRRGGPVSLAINESLLGRLHQAGILDPASRPALVLPEPAGRLASRLCGVRGGHAIRSGPESADNGRWGSRLRPVAGMVDALAFGVRKLDYLRGCVSVARWLVRQQADVMHLVLGGAYVALPLQVLGHAPPSVLSIVCPSLRDMVGTGVGHRLYRNALRRACLVDALTEAIADRVRAEGVPPDRVRASAGSCVDTERFRPSSAKHPWVAFSGRLIEEKNPRLFVEACALIQGRVPEARFVLLGDGPLRSEIDALIGRCGLSACTQVGWREDVEEVLGGARVFASLQRMDNYPSQALLEAMSCGTAVVATDVGLTGKLVDERVGVRVPATPEAVAEASVRLLRDPDGAEAMGRRARERVLREHSMDAYVDYLESVYEEAWRANLLSRA